MVNPGDRAGERRRGGISGLADDKNTHIRFSSRSPRCLFNCQRSSVPNTGQAATFIISIWTQRTSPKQQDADVCSDVGLNCPIPHVSLEFRKRQRQTRVPLLTKAFCKTAKESRDPTSRAVLLLLYHSIYLTYHHPLHICQRIHLFKACSRTHAHAHTQKVTHKNLNVCSRVRAC